MEYIVYKAVKMISNLLFEFTNYSYSHFATTEIIWGLHLGNVVQVHFFLAGRSLAHTDYSEIWL